MQAEVQMRRKKVLVRWSGLALFLEGRRLLAWGTASFASGFGFVVDVLE